MSGAEIAEIPERIESLATELSEALIRRHGDDPFAALVVARVIAPELAARLLVPNTPPDVVLDLLLTRALFNDGLTLVALVLLRTGDIRWDQLDDLLPLLTRFASFYSSVEPRYRNFQTLPRERLAEFWNAYCGDAAPFGLLCEPTRFLGIRLCAHHDGPLDAPEMTPRWLDGVLGPLWQHTATAMKMPPTDATALWQDVTRAAARWRKRLI